MANTTKRITRDAWRRASACVGGDCVEVREISGRVEVRDSKDPTGAVLTFDPAVFAAHHGVRDEAGRFHGEPEVMRHLGRVGRELGGRHWLVEAAVDAYGPEQRMLRIGSQPMLGRNRTARICPAATSTL